MKKYNPIYFLLFFMLVLGAFASMAQNSYGLKIIGGVAFAFALVFIVEFIMVIRNNDRKDVSTIAEPLCLFILAFIFGLRVFYIQFSYIEWLYAAAVVLLVLIYGQKMIHRYRQFQANNSLLAMLVLIIHLSIILFLISLLMIPFAPKVSVVTGVAALVLLLIFIVARFYKKKYLVDGENKSSFSIVKSFQDHSIVIVSMLLLFSLYTGLNGMSLLPGIYSDEYPRAYYDLVNKTSSSRKEPVNGKYKYQEFMEKYEEFLKHNNIKNQ